MMRREKCTKQAPDKQAYLHGVVLAYTCAVPLNELSLRAAQLHRHWWQFSEAGTHLLITGRHTTKALTTTQ